MDQATLRLLVDYHFWARDRMLAALEPLPAEQYVRDLGSSFRSIRDTAVHIYSAEWVWHSRWNGVSPTEPIRPDRFPDVPALAAEWYEHEGRLRGFVENLVDADVARAIEYRLMNGTPGRSEIGHMVQHVVNHATYHRGQVTTMLRQLGVEPPKSTDFITFDREREKAE